MHPSPTRADKVFGKGRVEDAIKIAKLARGLADYKVCSFHCWYHDITIAQLAAAFLAGCDAVTAARWAFKLAESTQDRRRAVTAARLAAPVRTGAKYGKGVLTERTKPAATA
ncbi:hypothetical protein ACIBCP_38150 [Streptomyces sp. NPDC051287]|uniref:hypothetical protein n=1 Tax=Streptomyces sp. NPDC051287 TaxID=3365648 RepID=UPI0037A044E9